MGRVTDDEIARLDWHKGVLPPGPYRVEWPAEQGGAFTLWGRQGTPPDFKDGWAIPLVASGVDTAMYALRDILNGRSPGGPGMTSERAVELAAVTAAWEALRQAIWENSPSYDPHDFIQDQRPAIEAAVLGLAAARGEPEIDGDEVAALREALRDANTIVAMTRKHLAEDHPDCSYTGLGLLNDASRAALVAARTPREPKV